MQATFHCLVYGASERVLYLSRCSPEHNDALLGSNSMRNRIAPSDSTGVSINTASRFNAKSFCQCQEKPRNEPLAVLQCQAAVVVQVLLQVGERSLYLVVRVRHSPTVFSLTGEKIRLVEVLAVHRRSQASMCIVHLSIFVEALMVDRVLPFLLPFLVVLPEFILSDLVKPA